MKKSLLIISLAIVSLLIPINTLAKIESTDLTEVVEEEISIFQNEDSYKEAIDTLKSYDISDYSESKEKINVYLFRGSTCSHCFEAVMFFAKIYKEYGQYFNLKSYEVWNNSDNSALMEDVGKELDKDVSGVPFIVIGKKSFGGYSSNYDEEIISAIKDEYDKSQKDRTDIVKSLGNINDTSDSATGDILSIIIIVLIAVGIIFGIKIVRART